MPVVVSMNLSALAVAALYYYWRDGYRAQIIRQRMLCERVAYLMWSASHYAA